MSRPPRNDKTSLELLDRFTTNGKVPFVIAQKFIQNSAYWHEHPSGHPVHAPRHFKRVQNGNTGWEIKFGANTFCVGMAIKECINLVRKELEKSQHTHLNYTILRYSMQMIISSSVANHNEELFYEYSVDDDGYMLFGTQAINADAFIDTILDYIHIERHCHSNLN